ncbi:protein containing molybdenum cofactor synthesis domain [Leptolinea tardivitalis]|nr:protein containing molybdenum cofactor synthesis domain [Leptolinea tardivitalis]
MILEFYPNRATLTFYSTLNLLYSNIKMPIAETIAIGTELLLGEIQDTNTHFIALQLRNAGIDFYRATMLGDNPGRIAKAVKEAATRADIVITSGGLGPTVDDPTREAIALAAGVELEFHEELWNQVQDRFRRYGRKPTENNRRQAYIPRGATAITNPVGTAPAFYIEIDGCIVVSLPGVPRELETLLVDTVIPLFHDRFHLKAVLRSVVIHAATAGESQIDEWVADLETGANPTVGLLAHPGITDIRITARADSEEEANHMIAGLREEVIKRIGQSYFGDDETTLEQVVNQMLADKDMRAFILLNGFDRTFETRIEKLEPRQIFVFTSTEDNPSSPELEIARTSGYEIIIRADLFKMTDQTNLAFTFITPEEEKSITRSHGGHPELAQTWAENMLLDFIRRYLYNKNNRQE